MLVIKCMLMSVVFFSYFISSLRTKPLHAFNSRFFLGGEECPRAPTPSLPKEKTGAGQHEHPHASLRSIDNSESSSSTCAHVESSDTQAVTPESCETMHTNEGADNTQGHPAESQSSKVTGSSQPCPSSSVLRSAIQALHQQFPCLHRLVCAVKEQLRPVLASLEQLPRHKCCPHSHSCMSYVLKVGSRWYCCFVNDRCT